MSKSYHLKLSEEHYNGLGNRDKLFLNNIGLEVRQIPSKEDLEDENYKKVRKHRIDAWNDEQKFLFDKRNK